MPLGISPVIGSRIETCAAVVQLEERFPAKEEVIGSNPIGCTITELETPERVFFIFRSLK